MTLAENIAQASASLPREQQREVLDFVEFLRSRPTPVVAVPPRRTASKSKAKKLHPAIQAIAGMWKDRTDLPHDPVAAVRVLRSRMISRSSAITP